MTPPVQTSIPKYPQLERLLSAVVLSLGFSGARVVVGEKVLASSGVLLVGTPLAELGLFDAEYNERGLLEVYGQIHDETLSAQQQQCLEDFAALASDLLATEAPRSLEQVCANTHMALVILDAQGRIESLNSVAEMLWECKTLELHHRRAEDVFTGSPESKRSLINTLLAGQTVQNFACTSQSQLGSPLQLNLQITPVLDAGGQMIRFVCCVEEVSEKHKVQNQLERQKEFYENILNHIPAEIAVLDRSFRYLYINPKAIKNPELRQWSLGKRDAEIIEHTGWKFDSLLERQKHLERVVQEGVVQSWEESFDSAKGRVYRQRNANPVFDASGELNFIVGYSADITALKKSEQAHSNALERLKLLERGVESSSDTITLYDSEFRAVYQNPAALLTFGRNLEEFNLNMESVLEPDRMATILEYLETHTSWSGELDVYHSEGRAIPCQVRVDSILGAEGQRLGTLSVVTDISHRREVEQVKDDFITTVSHELRTPLTSLRGALGLLAGDDWGAPGSAARDLIHIALSNTERLSRRISDILDIGNLESGKLLLQKRSLELGALLEGAALELTALYSQREVRLSLDILEDVQVDGNPERLLQVLIHLLDNAAKASPIGGDVSARILRQDRSVRLEVKDGGAGISPEFSPQIFRRFARADTSSTREQGGLGLGLAISKAIVEQHGGLIGFERLEQGGSVFFVELPLEGIGALPLEELADLI